jgi:K+-sensing histidine kinase KdpD
MKNKSRSIAILTILFGYILLQFIWWEVLLVRQSTHLMNEKQKLMELSISNELELKNKIEALHSKHQTQTIMIVCEGTVFLLLLLFGMYKVKKAIDKEWDLNQQQHNFFLSITHELKTPIAATKLQLQTLIKQKLDTATQQEIVQSALQENERLNNLIDNVLLAGRIESTEFSIKLNKENVSDLLENVIQRYYAQQIKTAQLKVTIQKDLYAMLDAQIFPSVITNLIDNALKYSGADKQLEVELKKENTHITLNVIDNGHGIADADKTKVFNRFYRVGNEETRVAKGTGLGLYIVQNIVTKHQGRIEIKNNQPKGSIFEIQLNAV